MLRNLELYGTSTGLDAKQKNSVYFWWFETGLHVIYSAALADCSALFQNTMLYGDKQSTPFHLISPMQK